MLNCVVAPCAVLACWQAVVHAWRCTLVHGCGACRCVHKGLYVCVVYNAVMYNTLNFWRTRITMLTLARIGLST